MSVDWPPPEELVDAVREFLEGEVMSTTTGRTQYLARVAANILATVGRELRDDTGKAVQRAAFDQLGVDDEPELCRRLCDGELDERLPEVADALRPLVRHRLGIANPRYLA